MEKNFHEPSQHEIQLIRKLEVLGLEFFKTKLIDEIIEGDLHDMMETLKLKNFKTQTIRQYRTATNGLFQYAKTMVASKRYKKFKFHHLPGIAVLISTRTIGKNYPPICELGWKYQEGIATQMIPTQNDFVRGYTSKSTF